MMREAVDQEGIKNEQDWRQLYDNEWHDAFP